MNKYLYLVVAVALSLFSHKGYSAGETGTHGGGGIHINGKYLTLGEAKIKIPDDPMDDLPEARELVQTKIKAMPLPHKTQNQFVTAISLLGDRQYFDLRETSIDPVFIQKLLAQYKNLITDSSLQDKLVLYAFTVGKNTYLLPEFFQLSDSQKQAILFHEALWVLNPKSDLADVVKAEIRFGNLAQTPNGLLKYDQKLYVLLAKMLGEPLLPLLSAAQSDAWTSSQAAFSLDTAKLLTSDDFVFDHYDANRFAYFTFKLDQTALESNLLELTQKYPDSATYRELYRVRKKLALSFYSTLCRDMDCGSDEVDLRMAVYSAFKIDQDSLLFFDGKSIRAERGFVAVFLTINP